MKRFIVALVVLLAVPMVVLNPMGREAFIGYYAGAIAMWLTFVCVGACQQRGREGVWIR